MSVIARRSAIVALILAVALPGCADHEPITYSETVSVKLGGIKEGDVTDGQAAEDKNINTESGNPYAVFLQNTKDALGGVAPARIGVRTMRVRMHADTTGANGLEDVFTELEVFVANDNTTIPLGSVTAPTGTDVPVEVTATADSLNAIQASLKAGSFKVGVRGPVVATPPAKFDLRLTVDIAFEAFE